MGFISKSLIVIKDATCNLLFVSTVCLFLFSLAVYHWYGRSLQSFSVQWFSTDPVSENTWEYQWGERHQVSPPGSGNWNNTRIDITPPSRSKHNFLWLRKKLPEKISTDDVLFIPGAYQLLDIYVNGVKVAGTENMDVDRPKVGAHPYFMIPLTPENSGDIVHFRVYSSQQKIGIMGIPKVDSRAAHTEHLIVNDLPRIIVGVLLFFLSVGPVLLNGNKKNPKAAISMAGFCAAFGIHTITRAKITYLFVPYPDVIATLSMLSLYALLISLGTFFHATFKGRFADQVLVLRNLQIVAFAGILTASLVQGKSLEDYNDFFGIIFMATMVFGVLTRLLEAKKVDIAGFFYSLALAVAGCAGLYDALVITGFLPWIDPVTPYGVIPLLFVIHLIINKNFEKDAAVIVPKARTINFHQNPITLHFNGIAEKQYRKFRFTQAHNTLRLGFIVTNFLTIAFGFFEYLYLDATLWNTIAPQVGIAIIIFNTIGLAITNRVDAWKYMERFFSFSVMVFHSAAAYIAISINPELLRPAFGPILVIILSTTLSASFLRWIYVAIPTAYISIVWGFAFYLQDAFPSFQGQPVFMVACLFLVSVVAILQAYSREKDMRSMFMLSMTVEAEQKASEKLLLSIMPEHVSERLKANAEVADHHSSVSIVFADLCGFTSFSSDLSARDLVKYLDEIITDFDLEASRLGVEKIKTIGDAYMAVSGLTNTDSNHADDALLFGRAMFRVLHNFNRKNGTTLKMRIGINSGSVTAGIIGKSKFSYDVWGDSVNIASRMENTSSPGFIQITKATYELLTDKQPFSKPVLRDIKGKGMIETYLLEVPPEVSSQNLKIVG